jgi:post-segregation antitoxin (ccd killing protein)
MHMARATIYLPDELAERARAAGLNISGLAQEAIEAELDRQGLRTWLSTESTGFGPISHDDVLAVLEGIRRDAS